MQIGEVFSSRQVRLVPSHKGNATLISTLQVHPWFQPASATRFMLQEPVIAFWIFQRKRKNNMDRFECFLQVWAGTMQGNNCFLYFHFSYYQRQWAKSTCQTTHTFGVCTRVGVCCLEAATLWLTENKGHAQVVIHKVTSHKKAKGHKWNCSDFVGTLPPASSLLWAWKQTLSVKKVNTTKACSFSAQAEREKSWLFAICSGYSVMCGIDFFIVGLIVKNKILRKMNALLCMLMLFKLLVSLVYHAACFGFNRYKRFMENF